MRHELGAITSEGVRFEDIGSRFHVLGMYIAHQLRVGQVQLIEGPADENTLVVQHRSHCAVADQNARRNGGHKISHKQKV